MDTLNEVVEAIEKSPSLPAVIRRLSQRMQAEEAHRQEFYRDLTPDQKAEFINGKVELHSPARARHLKVTGWIHKLLDTFVELNNLGEVFNEKCLCVFPRNDYEPDVVFFDNEKAKTLAPETLKFPVPDLAVEILSESTEARDRGVKFEDFAANGVQEYWIVDAEKSVLEQYILQDGKFHLNTRSGTGQLTSAVIHGLTLPITAFFDASANLTALRNMVGR